VNREEACLDRSAAAYVFCREAFFEGVEAGHCVAVSVGKKDRAGHAASAEMTAGVILGVVGAAVSALHCESHVFPGFVLWPIEASFG